MKHTWWNRIRRAFNALTGKETVSLDDEDLLEWLGIDSSVKYKNLSEVTYFTCLKMLSETMGKLPLKYYRETDGGRIRAEPSGLCRLLMVRPNAIMTPSTLWSVTEMNCEHYGNGYIWMRGRYVQEGSYGGRYEIVDLWPMQANYVTVLMDDVGVFGGKGKLYYQYSDPRSGKQYVFQSYQVMHFKTWFSFDGIMGQPVRDILKYTIDGMQDGQTFLNNLYKNGLTASMAMQYVGDLDEQRRKKLEQKFAAAMTGPKNAGKVIPVPMGLTLTPLKMNLTDAQFFELRKYSALQIAGAFGIKPNQINNYEKSSYANSETQQLSFLVDTMSFRLKMYEEEINAKALSRQEVQEGYLYKFNEKAILRTDAKTQMENLAKGVAGGIYTPNEARGYLDLCAKEGGDILVMNGNVIPVTQIGEQYKNSDS